MRARILRRTNWHSLSEVGRFRCAKEHRRTVFRKRERGKENVGEGVGRWWQSHSESIEAQSIPKPELCRADNKNVRKAGQVPRQTKLHSNSRIPMTCVPNMSVLVGRRSLSPHLRLCRACAVASSVLWSKGFCWPAAVDTLFLFCCCVSLFVLGLFLNKSATPCAWCNFNG